MRVALIVIAALLVSSAAVRAQDCANASDQATLDQCAGQEFEAADKQLNAAYKQISDRLKDDADTKKLLVTAQHAWVAFRDAECSFQGGSSATAGSVYPMVVATCKAGLTNARLKDLQGYLDCEEGDLSCHVPRAE